MCKNQNHITRPKLDKDREKYLAVSAPPTLWKALSNSQASLRESLLSLVSCCVIYVHVVITTVPLPLFLLLDFEELEENCYSLH